MSDVLVVIQARLGSTRLPGKVLETIGPMTCLEHVVERVKLTGYPYVLTIPDAPAEDRLAAFCEEHGYRYHRGPHPDVLTAFVQAAASIGAHDTVIRITADCPFVQPVEIVAFSDVGQWGYQSNAHPTRLVPKGHDVECFSWALMHAANTQATDDEDRHHVTPWMRRALGLGTSTDDGEFRVTLDTAEDLTVLRNIAAAINVTPPHPTLAELRAYFARTRTPA